VAALGDPSADCGPPSDRGPPPACRRAAVRSAGAGSSFRADGSTRADRRLRAGCGVDCRPEDGRRAGVGRRSGVGRCSGVDCCPKAGRVVDFFRRPWPATGVARSGRARGVPGVRGLSSPASSAVRPRVRLTLLAGVLRGPWPASGGLACRLLIDTLGGSSSANSGLRAPAVRLCAVMCKRSTNGPRDYSGRAPSRGREIPLPRLCGAALTGSRSIDHTLQ
jgi:hypothetical protein